MRPDWNDSTDRPLQQEMTLPLKRRLGNARENIRKDLLFSAWAYRLDVKSPHPEVGPASQTAEQSQTQRWWTAIATSVVLGVLYALCAGNEPPIPIPGEATPLFWIGWGPLTALGILFYLSMVERSWKQCLSIRRFGRRRHSDCCVYGSDGLEQNKQQCDSERPPPSVCCLGCNRSRSDPRVSLTCQAMLRVSCKIGGNRSGRRASISLLA